MAQSGSARALGARCRGFESLHSDMASILTKVQRVRRAYGQDGWETVITDGVGKSIVIFPDKYKPSDTIKVTYEKM